MKGLSRVRTRQQLLRIATVVAAYCPFLSVPSTAAKKKTTTMKPGVIANNSKLMMLLLLQRFRIGYTSSGFPLIQTNFKYQRANEGAKNPAEVCARFGKILAWRLCKV